MTKRRGALMRGSELVEYSRKADAKRSACASSASP
jgi:hypothetical protein